MAEGISRSVRVLKCGVAWTLSMVMLAGAGCDDAPEPPPELLKDDAPKLDEPPPPPSTQELMQGEYKTVKLADLPLTARVPVSWNIETLGAGSTTLLVGYAPGGRVPINLSHRPRATQEKIDIMLDGARKEMAEDPAHIRKVDLYNRGEMRIVERQVLSHGEMVADPSDPTAPSGRMMRWTITTFIPAGEEFSSYELNFIGLSARQFDADQAFLRNIIESLAYDPAAVAGEAPANPEK